MSNVEVPFGDNPRETAILLLAAAEELDLDTSVVATNSNQTFSVPEEVNERAFGKTEEKPKPQKRTAKKSTASKSTSEE